MYDPLASSWFQDASAPPAGADSAAAGAENEGQTTLALDQLLAEALEDTTSETSSRDRAPSKARRGSLLAMETLDDMDELDSMRAVSDVPCLPSPQRLLRRSTAKEAEAEAAHETTTATALVVVAGAEAAAAAREEAEAEAARQQLVAELAAAREQIAALHAAAAVHEQRLDDSARLVGRLTAQLAVARDELDARRAGDGAADAPPSPATPAHLRGVQLWSSGTVHFSVTPAGEAIAAAAPPVPPPAEAPAAAGAAAEPEPGPEIDWSDGLVRLRAAEGALVTLSSEGAARLGTVAAWLEESFDPPAAPFKAERFSAEAVRVVVALSDASAADGLVDAAAMAEVQQQQQQQQQHHHPPRAPAPQHQHHCTSNTCSCRAGAPRTLGRAPDRGARGGELP